MMSPTAKLSAVAIPVLLGVAIFASACSHSDSTSNPRITIGTRDARATTSTTTSGITTTTTGNSVTPTTRDPSTLIIAEPIELSDADQDRIFAAVLPGEFVLPRTTQGAIDRGVQAYEAAFPDCLTTTLTAARMAECETLQTVFESKYLFATQPYFSYTFISDLYTEPELLSRQTEFQARDTASYMKFFNCYFAAETRDLEVVCDDVRSRERNALLDEINNYLHRNTCPLPAVENRYPLEMIPNRFINDRYLHKDSAACAQEKEFADALIEGEYEVGNCDYANVAALYYERVGMSERAESEFPNC